MSGLITHLEQGHSLSGLYYCVYSHPCVHGYNWPVEYGCYQGLINGEEGMRPRVYSVTRQNSNWLAGYAKFRS